MINPASIPAFLVLFMKSPCLQRASDRCSRGWVCVKSTRENLESPCNETALSRSRTELSSWSQKRHKRAFSPQEHHFTEFGDSGIEQWCDLLQSSEMVGRKLSQVWEEPRCRESVPVLSHRDPPLPTRNKEPLLVDSCPDSLTPQPLELNH